MDNAVLEEFLSDGEIDGRLRKRLGSLHARQRLGIERTTKLRFSVRD